MQATIQTQAGIWSQIHTPGRLFMIDSISVATCEVRIVIPGRNDEQLDSVTRGFKAKMSEGHFSEVFLRTTADASIGIVISDNEVDINFGEGATVTATISGPLPLPVQTAQGDGPGNPLYTSNVAAADIPAASSPDNAAVACSAVIAAILAADADRRQIIFTNLGPDPVTLGSAGMTWAKRCIVLNINDSYLDDRAANLAWYGICDAGKTASVTTKTVKV